MRSPVRSLMLVGLAWAGAAFAQTAPEQAAAPAPEAPAPAAPAKPASLVLQPGAELVVDGKSTVRDFSCRAKELSARLESASPEASFALDKLAGAVREVKLEIPVRALDCDNDTMNEHMQEALGMEKNPTIELRINSYEVGTPADGVAPLKMSGELLLAGVTRPISVAAKATPAPDGTLRIEGRHLLKMTDWKVKPPSLMLGTMKVREAVVIRFRLTLK